ncbi:hypothetical protein [Streptomyces canus]|uniref:hypothetical protein n=1 Tax=Streptomyces canus TaxID=58343 RepID=UPI0038084E8D
MNAPGPANRPTHRGVATRAVVRREWEDTLVVDVGQRSESEETGPHAWVVWNSGVAGSIDDTDPSAAEPCWPIEDGDDLPVSASR